MTGKELTKTAQGKEVVTLGGAELFVRRDGAGVIRPMSMRITLKKGRDTYVVSGKTHISHMGYQACNVIANLSIMRPNTIFVDAVERSNPYIERNPVTQEAVNVHARSLAIGFAPTGNPVIVDKTVILNLRQYFLTDLKSKINKFPECGYFGAGKIGEPVCKEWFTKDGKREIKARENAVMRFMPTNEITPGDYVGYWFDVSHPEIISVYEQQRTRQQFAERNAISMASRNAMAEHPCMPVKDCTAEVNPRTGDAVVLVHGYRHDASGDDLKELAQAAANGDLSGVQKKGIAEAQLHDTGTERIVYEEVQAEEEVAAEEAAEPEKEKKTRKKRGKKDESWIQEPKTEKKEEEPAEEKPVEDKKEEKAKDVYDEPSQVAPPPVDPETGEIADEEEKVEEPREEPVKHSPINKAHTQLEGAERIMSNPRQINEVAHEIFPETEFKDWRELPEDDKEVLLAELISRTQSGR